MGHTQLVACIAVLHAAVGSDLRLQPAALLERGAPALYTSIRGRCSDIQTSRRKAPTWQMAEESTFVLCQIGKLLLASSETTEGGTPISVSPMGNHFSAQRPLALP